MKKIVLTTFCTLFMIGVSFGQIFIGQINDFEDGTTQGWSNGNNSPNPPTNIATGGPTGANDNFLEEISTGGAGAGSKLIIFNTDADWLGDYAAAGIAFIGFNAQVITNEDLQLRIAVEGGLNNSQMVTTNATIVPGGSSWNSYSIFVEATDFTVLSGGETVVEILSNVTDLRILHNPNLDFNGASIDATLHLDNIFADGPVNGVNEFALKDVTIYPNPAYSSITIQSKIALQRVQFFDVLGKLVQEVNLDGIATTVDISALTNGVYIAKFISESGSVSKKIVKL